MSDYTLLTGSTGLLGRYLLRDLLVAGHHLVVIVRSTAKESARQRIESILQHWEKQLDRLLPRPVCLEGDLCTPYLGLDEISRQWLAEHCTAIVHSGATLTFEEEPNGEPWRTNVGGTRHVLELCRDVDIRQMHYVSTAYVCGTRGDRIMEDELDLGQSLRNDYERSKLEAETLVRKADSFDQVTVYRPTVIAGDSRTGYTNTYHGLFMYLQIMSVFSRNIEPDADGIRRAKLQLRLTGDEPRNIIPVDWASAVIAHLFATPKSHGRTFHLAPRVRMTARQMVEAGYSFYNSAGVEFIGPAPEADRDVGEMERDAYDNSTLYREYEVSDPEFDTANLDRFAGHLRCPEIDEAMFHRFMKFGEEDRWGKRRQKPARVPLEIGEHLERSLVTKKNSSPAAATEAESTIGLDIVGPGGGRWTVALNQHGLVAVEAGVSSACSRILEMTSTEFRSLLGGGRWTAEDGSIRKLSREERRVAEALPAADLSDDQPPRPASAVAVDLA